MNYDIKKDIKKSGTAKAVPLYIGRIVISER